MAAFSGRTSPRKFVDAGARATLAKCRGGGWGGGRGEGWEGGGRGGGGGGWGVCGGGG